MLQQCQEKMHWVIFNLSDGGMRKGPDSSAEEPLWKGSEQLTLCSVTTLFYTSPCHPGPRMMFLRNFQQSVPAFSVVILLPT